MVRGEFFIWLSNNMNLKTASFNGYLGIRGQSFKCVSLVGADRQYEMSEGDLDLSLSDKWRVENFVCRRARFPFPNDWFYNPAGLLDFGDASFHLEVSSA